MEDNGHTIIIRNSTVKNKVELKPVVLDDEYRKKWRVHQNDFYHLYVNGIRANDSLYRVGGFGTKLNEKYFILLKQVESTYDKKIMSETKKFAEKMGDKHDNNPRHLANCSCIIDENGVEKKVFQQFDSPWTLGGCIYKLNNQYRNIETDELILESSGNCMSSNDYLFVNDEFNRDKEKRGVVRICKWNGKTKLYRYDR